jgi:hypothetical protein
VTDGVENPPAKTDPDGSALAGTGFYVAADLGYAWQLVNEADVIDQAGPSFRPIPRKARSADCSRVQFWSNGSVAFGIDADVELLA